MTGKLLSVAEGLNWLSMAYEYYSTGGITLGVAPDGKEVGVGMHTVQRTDSWTQSNMFWIPLQTAEVLVKTHVFKEGDQFARTFDGPVELYVIRNAKPEPTGYVYRADENAFVGQTYVDPTGLGLQ